MSDEDEITERIAGELHDGVIQWLVGAKMQAEGLRFQIGKGQQIELDAVDSLVRTLNSGIRDARRLMRGLSGPQIQDGYWCGPLRAELNTLLRQTQADKSKTVALEMDFADGVEPLDDRLAANAFRLVREAVWNALRHAGADVIQVTASSSSEYLTLSITDDGRGFDPTKVSSTRMGVRGLSRRAESIGGSVEIETAPSAGTKIVCRLPLAAP